MSKMSVARPYAKAILLNAKEFNSFAKWSHDLDILNQITQQKELQPLLKKNLINQQKLLPIYEDLGKYISKEAMNLVRILAERKRLSYLPEIYCLFVGYKNEVENKLVLHVKSTHPLGKTEEANLADYFKKILQKKIEVHPEIDSNLMGGFVARAGNYVLDGSLKNRLTELKEAMGD